MAVLRGRLGEQEFQAAGGGVFAGSVAGTRYALNGDTGTIEWSFPSGGSVVSGPSIVGGDVSWALATAS